MRSAWRDEIKPAWHDEIKSTKSNKLVWRDEIDMMWCGGQWYGMVRSAMREPDTQRERERERDVLQTEREISDVRREKSN